jgi:hypothetical protein
VNRLLRSSDGLATASVVSGSPQPYREIAFAPSDPLIVYAETDGYLLYRSDDAGVTWRLVANVRAEVLNIQP